MTLVEIDNTSPWNPVVGGALVAGGLVLGFGPMIAYFLGWADMPLIVGVLTNIASLPFGVVLVGLGAWIVTHSNGLIIDGQNSTVTAWQKNFGKYSEEKYRFSDFDAVTVTFYAKSRRGSDSYFQVRLRGPSAEDSPGLKNFDYSSEALDYAEKIAKLLSVKVVQSNFSTNSQ